MAPQMSSEWYGPASTEPAPVNQACGRWILPCDAWLYLRDALRLSERELLIVEGLFEDREQEILARSLGISPETFYRTLQRIYVKLRIGSTAELVVRVMSEYLTFVADQTLADMPVLSYWPVKHERTFSAG